MPVPLPSNTPEKDPLRDDVRRAIIDRAINENLSRPGAVMVVLNELQNRIGFISEAMQAYVARRLGLPVGAVHGVVTFYSFFTTEPRGDHTVKFCMGTACYVGGMPQLIDKAQQVAGVEMGKTTADGAVTLEVCRCVGACSQAPVIMVDEDVVGRVRPNKLPALINKLREANAATA